MHENLWNMQALSCPMSAFHTFPFSNGIPLGKGTSVITIFAKQG